MTGKEIVDRSRSSTCGHDETHCTVICNTCCVTEIDSALAAEREAEIASLQAELDANRLLREENAFAFAYRRTLEAQIAALQDELEASQGWNTANIREAAIARDRYRAAETKLAAAVDGMRESLDAALAQIETLTAERDTLRADLAATREVLRRVVEEADGIANAVEYVQKQNNPRCRLPSNLTHQYRRIPIDPSLWKDQEIARLTAERDKWKTYYELADTPMNDAARLVLEDTIKYLKVKLLDADAYNGSKEALEFANKALQATLEATEADVRALEIAATDVLSNYTPEHMDFMSDSECGSRLRDALARPTVRKIVEGACLPTTK
jgi:hypothetical protein